ncbi:hypothetical protein ACQJBY_071671 [Aegilops geniculata]
MICTLWTLRLWLIQMCCNIQILCWKRRGEEGVGLGKYNDGSWTKRVMVANNHDEKDRDPNRVSTVEPSLRVYADKKSGAVVNPATGTSFNSLEEAYDFYNPYSWESGFGV